MKPLKYLFYSKNLNFEEEEEEDDIEVKKLFDFSHIPIVSKKQMNK